MATGGIETDLVCIKCYKIVTNYTPLDCLHDVCQPCIEEVDKNSDPKIKIECPKCKRCTPVTVVPQSTPVTYKIKALQSPRITQHDLTNIELDIETILMDQKHIIRRFVNYRNGLWVANEVDKCLYVYKYDLTFDKAVPCSAIHKPCTLHPYTSQKILVGGENGLFIVDPDYQMVENRILQGEVDDVHVNQGLIAALVDGITKRYVQVLQRSLPCIEVFKKVHSDALTVLITPDEKVLVSDSNNHITEYNNRGDIITQYGRYGKSEPGEFSYPYLCLSDTSGNILVADCLNHRLQMRTKDGDWIVPQLQRNIIEYPTDISVTDTHLYVKYGKKIHKFALRLKSK